MRPLCLAFVASSLLAQQVIPLRPNSKPDPGTPAEKIEERGTNGVVDRSISAVSEPTVTVYLAPKSLATGTAIVICPGGGYQHLAIDKEGHDIARWLTTIGITGVVLKYRLPGQANMRASLGDLQQAAQAARVAIEDAQDAMVLVRAQARQWNLKPHSVGMMGFSAGGHLAAMLGMIAPDEARPDFLVLGYPAIPKTLNVTAKTPPTFLVHADDDRLAPKDNSVRFYEALKEAKVPAELHVYATGGHGFGIRKTDKTSAAWPQALVAWLSQLARN